MSLVAFLPKLYGKLKNQEILEIRKTMCHTHHWSSFILILDFFSSYQIINNELSIPDSTAK